MVSRAETKLKHQRKKQAVQRYEQHRKRNVLAKPGVHNFIIILDNLKTGFNVPKIFRSAEAFGAHEVHLINIGQFDPAPAKGGFKNVPVRFHESFDSCYQDLGQRGYRFFTLEPVCDNKLTKITLPEKSAFILGHEEMGISFDRKQYPDIECLTIPQFGMIESLNVSIAASIVMYEYIRQHSSS
jgi:tRNA G18 (ribose-2'-O)-methylase SpoU